VPGCFILADDFGTSHAVYYRYSCPQGTFGRGLVTGVDGAQNLLDTGTEQRPPTSVMHAPLFSLSGAFSGLR
tara:strand:- start:268 stop:483 length:216 start_codon:yes stop_codon:yes gene_type:complete